MKVHELIDLLNKVDKSKVIELVCTNLDFYNILGIDDSPAYEDKVFLDIEKITDL